MSALTISQSNFLLAFRNGLGPGTNKTSLLFEVEWPKTGSHIFYREFAVILIEKTEPAAIATKYHFLEEVKPHLSAWYDLEWLLWFTWRLLCVLRDQAAANLSSNTGIEEILSHLDKDKSWKESIKFRQAIAQLPHKLTRDTLPPNLLQWIEPSETLWLCPFELSEKEVIELWLARRYFIGVAFKPILTDGVVMDPAWFFFA